MQLKYLLLPLIFIVAGCGNGNGSKTGQNGTTSGTQQNGKDGEGNSGGWERLIMTEFKDQKGNLIAEMPFPSSWKISKKAGQGEPSITGPNGIKITDYAGKSFMYTNNPQMQQIYYQSGMQLRAMPGIDRIIEEDIKPAAAQKGLTYVRHAEVPEVSKIDKWYSDQLYKAVPSQTDVKAIGVDFKSADGSPYYLLLHVNTSNSADLQNWYYFSSSLEADAGHFEAAKKQYLFSLANTHYALEPIAEYNQKEAAKAGKSWADFNKRMAQNQANFEAQQREHVNRTNAINDAIMKGYHDRDVASDKNQEQFINTITEKTKVTDPTTGQVYKVNSHYNQYWMNKDGEYISSNKVDYDPNLDDNMNDKKWQELKEVE